jgi:hypothetical protein
MSKKNGDGPINVAPSIKKKKLGVHPPYYLPIIPIIEMNSNFN